MNDQLTTIVLVVLLLGLSGFSLAKRARARKEAARKLGGNAVIVDVRTPEEFGSGHYPDAINIPLDRIETSLKRLGPAATPIVVYCASGSRSARAKNILRANGYTDVTDAGPLSAMPRGA